LTTGTCSGCDQKNYLKFPCFVLFQGKAISAAEAFFGMGTMFGPSLGGALYEYGGFSLPFWISGTGT
jgi:hypothetical protein